MTSAPSLLIMRFMMGKTIGSSCAQGEQTVLRPRTAATDPDERQNVVASQPPGLHKRACHHPRSDACNRLHVTLANARRYCQTKVAQTTRMYS